MRVLDFADLFESGVAPSTGSVSVFNVFASDAAFEADKGSAGAAGDIYYNTTTNNIRFFKTGDGWVNIVKDVISASRASPNNITAAGGITASVSAQSEIQYVQGSGGPINITANPQITVGTFAGQKLVLIGRNDTNTLTLEHGTGLALNGPCVLVADAVIGLVWDGTNWVEMFRNDI